ncbi:CPS_HP_G0109620.mRNA.1.CDS.1 [Saccharomyces cerevisiae]|nr:CPS_HP_G0058060.mRNA.1.CDS.1 [Saccharomyces cerevisiae]CAI4991587.1 CPS_HP_G0068680.mRNA.1.CDS.1 [Saccharomyces cerevisiae]CAI5047952.1 CPS_HP_G0109620.mRNA.1.CDS.1 [Saccharomyces cerevisiae]CAI6799095.1 CPS_HP_G0058060.mRNA.1.CDS.1 [Saccharomyces cerevisiae]CAI6866386.1 CPS_HP_G0068680.mRNA.1.CDS.1 [Saccharomyces cerevisiae]
MTSKPSTSDGRAHSISHVPGTHMRGTSASHSPRPFRPCADCTCSPGLLSRQGRRASLFLRQLENSRRSSSMLLNELKGAGGGSSAGNGSVYSCDSLCAVNREVNTTDRLLKLRQEMKKHDLCCYIVPSCDEHQSEYVSLRDQRRAFISGFSGSAGVACITRDLLNFNDDHPDGKSILSTDGRYFNQARQELDYNWTLLRQNEDPIAWQEWCVREALEMAKGLGNKEGMVLKIGIDPKLITFNDYVSFRKMIDTKYDAKGKVELVPVEENLVDSIWPDFETLPERPCNDLLLLKYEFHGEEFKDKKEKLLKKLNDKASSATTGRNTFIVVALDEVCWLLNLRGSDIDYNPVFFSYVAINEDETILFTNNPFNDDISEYFKINGIEVRPYEQIWEHLTKITSQASSAEHEFLIPDSASWQMVRCLNTSTNANGAVAKKMTAQNFAMIHSPIDVLKSIKNDIEIKNAHKAQVKDAVCLVQYFAWLEQQLVGREALIDEYRAAEKLTEIRKTQRNFMGNSFETISSTGSNAAIIHYSPPVENSSMIDPTKIYLCDSGSQFLEGTTDITRTIHLTKPTKEEMDNYTLVLKGGLALERLIFPENTPGFNIDAIARQFLWSRGLDYKHGTGHGIGSFLNVHEGPMGVGFRPHLMNFPLRAGNIISNEPGYYKDGEYGIRIESDMLIKKATEKGNFLKFENMTVVPYCRKLINTKLLNEEEKTQINEYHARVWRTIVHFLQPQSISYKWLKRETSPL